MKYLKLLRLDEHYPVLGCVLASSLYLQQRGMWIIWWSLGAISFSIIAFVTNELVDRNDVDVYSWNKIHVGKLTKLDNRVLAFLFVFFIISGFVFSYLSGFFWWGIAFFIIGVLYSLKPFRLKSRFALDILAQVACAFVIPFLAPIYSLGTPGSSLLLLLNACLILWAIVFPYQLADYKADVKARLKSTHVVLGMRKSLLLGLLLVLGGVILFFYFRIFSLAPWLSILLVLVGYTAYKYVQWLRMSNLNSQTLSMQKYAGTMKPLSQLLVPYVLIWMLL
ncbi:UbiA family prenyltransferase [Candidatus Roizmanbacteria bacterium]|nr:UbiA family prenyltransferase [Candidatus Roizmanbacteria bacterium]